MRDEGPYLLEWIAHHLGAGITDFLIYSNDCDDQTAHMLNLLQDAGIITHVPQIPTKGKSIQWQALQAAWKHPLRKAADWVLVSDVDEFLNIHHPGHSVRDLLSATPSDIDGIVLLWRLFGHNGVSDIVDAPVTTQFTHSIQGDTSFPIAASLFKTLFRARGPFNQLGVHRPRQKTADKAPSPVFVDGSGQRLPQAFADNQKRLSLYGLSQGRALAEINHYSIRSAAAFLIKRARGLPNRAHKPVDLSYWSERNFNTEPNDSIAPMRAATEQQLARLWEIPGLADLHASSVIQHQKRFNALVKSPEEQMLFSRILVAGGSVVPDQALQQRLISMYQAANSS
jgi:hypothetical protein